MRVDERGGGRSPGSYPHVGVSEGSRPDPGLSRAELLTPHPRRPTRALEVDFLAAGDEADASLVGGPCPSPLEHDEETVAESDEVEDVNECPEEPCEEAAEAEASEVCDGGGAADGGEVSEVPVSEGLARSPVEVASDHARDVPPGLDGDLCDTGEGLTVLDDVCEVADDEDFGVAGDRAVFFDDDAASAVEGGAECGAER